MGIEQSHFNLFTPFLFNFVVMKLKLTVSLLSAAILFLRLPSAGAYNDHRGHNLDSLERVVARWTPDMEDNASLEELIDYNRACRDLMLGYEVLNGEKGLFYAKKAISISRREGWEEATADAARHIGQYFYGREVFDSAMVYFKEALASVEKMAGGATSPTSPEGYSESDIDDTRSALYGAIGNLYNVMDSLPLAMDYYERAGAIFEKYGWNESNSILYYNIGETWMDEGDLKQASDAYDKALGYAEASGDSLMLVSVYKGLGRLYMEKGKTRKSLRYLKKADAYYSAHPDYSPDFRTENLEFMRMVLSRQKSQMAWIIAGLAFITLAVIALVLIARQLRRIRQKKAEAEEIMDETLGEIRDSAKRQTVSAPELSEREKEILELLSKGYTAPQIAEALNLSQETIKWYRKKLIAKFDVANTAELISQAKEAGAI